MTVEELTKNQKLHFWYTHIQNQRNSNMTVKAYCEANDLKPQTFYAYLKKIRQMLCDEYNKSSNQTAVVPFVSLPKNKLESQDKIIVTKGGIRIELETGTSYDDIESVMRALLC